MEKPQCIRVKQHIAYRESDDERWHVLIARDDEARWARCGWILDRHFTAHAKGATEIDEQTLIEKQVRACASPIGLPELGSQRADLRSRARASWLCWFLSPPLAFGAHRGLVESAAERAQGLVLDELPWRVADIARTEAEARAGWEQGRARLKGIEERATFFLGTTSISATILVGTSATVIGSAKNLSDPQLGLALLGTAFTVIGFLASGIYALTIIAVSFARISPDITSQVITRASLDDQLARRRRTARLLASRRRTSYIATWKLARLKRAAVAVAVALCGVLLTLSAVTWAAIG